jgi:hypothetical protein
MNTRSDAYTGLLAQVQYQRRIREVDALCDEAELRGVAVAPPELAPLGIGLGWMRWLLERARLGEIDDPPTLILPGTGGDTDDTLPSIAGLLHVAAQLGRES